MGKVFHGPRDTEYELRDAGPFYWRDARKKFTNINQCQYCGAFTSEFGLGLVTSVTPEGKLYQSQCVECAQTYGWNWFPHDMRAVFEMLDRVPWVPTEREQEFWTYWNIDHWFARRK